jgi:hypothetical protein
MGKRQLCINSHLSPAEATSARRDIPSIGDPKTGWITSFERSGVKTILTLVEIKKPA